MRLETKRVMREKKGRKRWKYQAKSIERSAGDTIYETILYMASAA